MKILKSRLSLSVAIVVAGICIASVGYLAFSMQHHSASPSSTSAINHYDLPSASFDYPKDWKIQPTEDGSLVAIISPDYQASETTDAPPLASLVKWPAKGAQFVVSRDDVGPDFTNKRLMSTTKSAPNSPKYQFVKFLSINAYEAVQTITQVEDGASFRDTSFVVANPSTDNPTATQQQWNISYRYPLQQNANVSERSEKYLTEYNQLISSFKLNKSSIR